MKKCLRHKKCLVVPHFFICALQIHEMCPPFSPLLPMGTKKHNKLKGGNGKQTDQGAHGKGSMKLSRTNRPDQSNAVERQTCEGNETTSEP